MYDLAEEILSLECMARLAALNDYAWYVGGIHTQFSFKEIAARAGIAETAAKLRSSRGVAQLRALLRGDTSKGPGETS